MPMGYNGDGILRGHANDIQAWAALANDLVVL